MDYKKVYEKIEKAVNDYEDGEYNTDADGYLETIGKIIRAHRDDEEEDIKKRRVILCGGKVEPVIFLRLDFSDKTNGEGLTYFEHTLKQLEVDEKYWNEVDSVILSVASYKILRRKSKY